MTKKYSIVIEKETFTSNEEGFFDLNEIWQKLNLPDNKHPAQWRKDFKSFHEDREDIIAYAMFVSEDFYYQVISSVDALRAGNVEYALNLAMETRVLEEQDAVILKAINTPNLFSRDQAFKMANIHNPRIFFKALQEAPEFLAACEEKRILEFKTTNLHKDRTWRCSPNGIRFFARNHMTINLWVETYKLNQCHICSDMDKYMDELMEEIAKELRD